MSLPDLIEIVPLEKPVRAEITVPGSKSITNRALILAALAEGEVTLNGALWSEDTQIMVECLQELGFMVDVQPDHAESCNRIITVYGKGGVVPPGGTEQQPMELFVGNAGTAARFLSAFVCLGRGVYRLHGVPRMNERPQAALFQALRELGFRIESDNRNDRLPVKIWGGSDAAEPRSRDRSCTVSIQESSQFASGLLLCARTGNWDVKVTGDNVEESPYVEMTRRLVETFPRQGGKFVVEPDASSGSYFKAANWLVSVNFWMKDFLEHTPYPQIESRFNQLRESVQSSDGVGRSDGSAKDGLLELTVRNWPTSGWQIDADFPSFIPLPATVSREGQLGDSIMMAIVLAADIWGGMGIDRREKGIEFTDLGRLRLQECERVVALRTELTKCGATVRESGDTLTVLQTKLHGAEIETYDDHRMAMCFAILGLKVPGIKLKKPACVRKTFPNFFQKLADAPPHGLGATIRDAKTGGVLTHEELFAS